MGQCVIRMAEGKDQYMKSLKEIKQQSKEELDKNLSKIVTMKETLAKVSEKYEESSLLANGYNQKNAGLQEEVDALKKELEETQLKVKEVRKEAKIMRDERVNNNKVADKRIVATQEEIVRMRQENIELFERIESLKKGFGDCRPKNLALKKPKLFGNVDEYPDY